MYNNNQSNNAIRQEQLPGSTPYPVTPSERLPILDILRGFAIFGILLVNVHYYARPIRIALALSEPGISTVDYYIKAATYFFIAEKFFSMLSILFGIGMAIIFDRVQKKHGPFFSIYARRLIGLLIIGILHAVFFYAGDFIGDYALLGFFLLLFRNRKPKTILISSIIILLFPVFLMAPRFFALRPQTQQIQKTEQRPEDIQKRRQARINKYIEQSVQAYGKGTFQQLFMYRLNETRSQYFSLMFTAWKIFPMFLLGLWAYRKGYVTALAQNLPFIKKVMWVSLIIGVAGCAFSLYTEITRAALAPFLLLLSFLGQQIGAPALAIFYIAAIILLYYSNIGKTFLSLFAPVGRMAMSNYIFQSLIFTTLFYSYGFGLYNKTNYAQNLLMALVFMAIQIVLSYAWLKKFSYGPLEWLLRRFSYLTNL